MRLRRRDLLGALAGAFAVPGAARAGGTRARPAAPELHGLKVANGGRPLAGDGRLFATLVPGTARGVAVVSFRLDRAARVRVEAVRTDTIRIGRPAGKVVWRTERRLVRGAHTLTWRPPRDVQPRTYLLRLVVDGRRTYGGFRPGPKARVDAPVVRVQGVEIAMTRRSYPPGEAMDTMIACDTPSLRLQVFHYGGSTRPSDRDLRTNGLAVTPPVRVDWRANRNGRGRLRVSRAGDWQSGLYFMRATAEDGRVGYAPFILRPRRLGENRTAVVLATNTWQAYNFYDANGDGWGDSWYVADNFRSVDVTRPYLDFGVPFRFRDWDLTFIAWLNRTGKRVDFLSDEDVEGARTAARLRAAYDLIVFPGHEEYVTKGMYDIVERYRDLGGNLMFLAANNFFWKVRRDGRHIVKEELWRKLGRAESGLVGVQYVGSDQGQRQGPYVVRGAHVAPWLFEGTGLVNGSRFGRYGIEIDARTAASPRGTQVLAEISNLMGTGRSAQMTYYETPAGARVFAAGAINFAASIDDPAMTRLVENAWTHLSAP